MALKMLRPSGSGRHLFASLSDLNELKNTRAWMKRLRPARKMPDFLISMLTCMRWPHQTGLPGSSAPAISSIANCHSSQGGGGVGGNRGHSRAAPGKIHFWAQRECWGVDWNVCGEVLLEQLLGERREKAGGERFWVYYATRAPTSVHSL